jgi:hypothetical protein
MDGQAIAAPESGGLSDLASFLSDTPDVESVEEEEATQAEDPTGSDADTETEANSEQTDEQADDSEEPEAEEESAPATKITFKVKGEDGAEETIEATTEELSKSYMRQADYSRKTQALAERESEAVKILTQRHEEMRSQYLSQAEVTRTAIVNMAGIKTEQEMAQLANSDPASWVAEQQRQRQIGNYLNQLDQQINGEKQQAELQRSQQFQQHLQQQYQKAWDDLSKDGIDKPKLQKIYGDTSKHYGFSNEELGNVYDSRLVRMMKDAAAYRDLQAQKSVVTKKAQDAPRMPSRQNAPAQERIDKALDSKFKSGRAKLNDLAAYLR